MLALDAFIRTREIRSRGRVTIVTTIMTITMIITPRVLHTIHIDTRNNIIIIVCCTFSSLLLTREARFSKISSFRSYTPVRRTYCAFCIYRSLISPNARQNGVGQPGRGRARLTSCLGRTEIARTTSGANTDRISIIFGDRASDGAATSKRVT